QKVDLNLSLTELRESAAADYPIEGREAWIEDHRVEPSARLDRSIRRIKKGGELSPGFCIRQHHYRHGVIEWKEGDELLGAADNKTVTEAGCPFPFERGFDLPRSDIVTGHLGSEFAC